MKHCSKCGIYKPLSEYHKAKTNQDGLTSACKQCTSEYGKKRRAKIAVFSNGKSTDSAPCSTCGGVEKYKNGQCAPCRRAYNKEYAKNNKVALSKKAAKYYADKKESELARGAEYRRKNKEAINARAKRYREEQQETVRKSYSKWAFKNKEVLLISKKAYRENNREEINARARSYREKNKEVIKKSQKKWREENKEYLSERQYEYRQSNKDRITENYRNYIKSHPEVVRERNSRRRARLANCEGKISKTIASKLLALQKGKCPCCGKPLGDDYHIDHIVPLALGGSNTDGNIQLLRAECNMKKSAKDPIAYMQERGFLL